MYKLLLITHFLGLALGVGTSFAMLTLGIASRNLSPEARSEFFIRVSLLGKNGSIGLLLLLVSGIAMMFDRGAAAVMALGGGAFHAKLTLVVILSILVGYMQVLTKRARNAKGGPALALLPKLGRVVLLLGVGIVIAAVLAFH